MSPLAVDYAHAEYLTVEDVPELPSGMASLYLVEVTDSTPPETYHATIGESGFLHTLDSRPDYFSRDDFEIVEVLG